MRRSRANANHLGRPGAARRGRSIRARAFTLVELVAVMALLAVLAATATPALRAIGESRDAALARELARRLATARAMASATGRPCGVRFDKGLRRITPLWIPPDKAAPAPAPGETGAPSKPLSVASLPGGGAITSFVNGDGGSAYATVWFAPDGAPHLRKANGQYVGPFTTDARVIVGGAPTVYVRRATGAIEP